MDPWPPTSWRARLRLWSLRLLRLAVLGWLVVALLSVTVADHLLYRPPPAQAVSPGQEPILLPDGQDEVALRWLPGPPGAPVVLFCHGNAEDLRLLEPFLQRYREAGFSIAACDYPGYGASSGRPSEAGLIAAAERSWRWLVEEQGIAPERIIVHGRSLGGGPAAALAARRPIGGLILESPFLTAFRVMTVWPLLPWDRYRNDRQLQAFAGPVLILHGARDRTIPAWHGRRLAALAGDRARLLVAPDAGHNDLARRLGPAYWQAIHDLADRVLAQDR